MKPVFGVEELGAAVSGEIAGRRDAEVSGVSTDSRTVEAGELFIPLKGERFDGHQYIDGALSRGVGVFLAERDGYDTSRLPSGATCIVVRDTLRALGDLAAFYRDRFAVPVAAVTGSNGKTTTKEMLASILGLTGPGLKTSGNLNNLIGLPVMLLQLRQEHRWAVLEMGMSEPGEIDRLAEIARPQVGVITNASAAHLLSMGTVEAVARAKGELFLRLTAGSCAVFNADDPLVASLPSPAGVARLSFGLGEADVRGERIEESGRAGQGFVINLPSGGISVRLRALGRHNVLNALAAAATAYALGVDPEVIRVGLEAFIPVDKRLSPEELNGILLVDDSYNANPASMKAALMTLRQVKESGRGIAVLGDMLELGDASTDAHREVGRLAASSVERLYLLGSMAETVAAGAVDGGLAESAIVMAKDHDEIIADLLGAMRFGDCILVKGSRGMRMETVAQAVRTACKTCTLKGAVN